MDPSARWVRSRAVELHLSQEPEADALLSSNPFALLVGMVLDQQVPLEWAFASPAVLQRRLGKKLDARALARMNPDALAEAFSSKPALHRYPGSMAGRVHELSRMVADRYNGKAERIWEDASSGPELLTRVKELPGFGEQKAKIFVALLGKQLGVRPQGWDAVSAPYSDPGSFRSVADIVDPDTLGRVRAFKQELKAAHKRQAEQAGRAAPGARATGAKKVGRTKDATTKAATKKAVPRKTAATKVASTKAAPRKGGGAARAKAATTTKAAAKAGAAATAGKSARRPARAGNR